MHIPNTPTPLIDLAAQSRGSVAVKIGSSRLGRFYQPAFITIEALGHFHALQMTPRRPTIIATSEMRTTHPKHSPKYFAAARNHSSCSLFLSTTPAHAKKKNDAQNRRAAESVKH